MDPLNFPSGTSGKEPACQCRRQKRCRFNPWVRKIPFMATHSSIHSCLKNPIERGAWWAIVHIHKVAKSWTWLKWLITHIWILGNQLPAGDPPQTNAHLCKTQHSNLGAHKGPEALPHTVIDWIVVSSKFIGWSPGPQDLKSETVFGDRVFKEVIKLRSLGWALIQYNRCPYKHIKTQARR